MKNQQKIAKILIGISIFALFGLLFAYGVWPNLDTFTDGGNIFVDAFFLLSFAIPLFSGCLLLNPKTEEE